MAEKSIVHVDSGFKGMSCSTPVNLFKPRNPLTPASDSSLHWVPEECFSQGRRELSAIPNQWSRTKKKASGRTTPEPHFHAKRQFRFLVKPVLAAKLRLLPTGRNEAHHLQTFLKIAITVMTIHFNSFNNFGVSLSMLY